MADKKAKRKFKRKPSAKQIKYVEGVALGKTKKQAALDAGYSPSTAHNPQNIEGDALRREFRKVFQRHIGMERIARKFSDLMDAKETRCFQTKDGVQEFQVEALEVQLRAATTAPKLAGYFVEKAELDVTSTEDSFDDPGVLEALLARVAARLDGEDDARGAAEAGPVPSVGSDS